MHPVIRTILERIALGVATLFVVSLVIFSAIELLPGDFSQVILGQAATKANMAAIAKELGLDQPPHLRYIKWISGVIQGDLGTSFSGRNASGVDRSRDVVDLIAPRLSNTLFLASMTAIIAVPISLVLGVTSALYRNSIYDRTVNTATLTTISFPEFFVAYILILSLSSLWPIFPSLANVDADTILSERIYKSALPALTLTSALYRNSIYDRTVNTATLTTISFPEFFVAYILILSLSSLWPIFPSLANVDADTILSERIYKSALPALTLTLVIVAHMMRMTRAAIINLLASPYIQMARLSGASQSEVIIKHALPNAWAPIATVIAFNLAYLVVGVVVVEVVFVYPGVGQLMVDAVSTRDIPVVQGCALIFAITYILLNLIADIIGIVTNPRLLHPK